MTDARSGGQYSLVRATTGLALALYFASFRLVARPEFADHGAHFGVPELVLLGALALLFAAGLWTRALGITLLLLWTLLHRSEGQLERPDVLAVVVSLALQGILPRDPFGSWPARGRVDPDGGWRFPAWVAQASWAALALCHLGYGAQQLARDGLAVVPLLQVSLAPLLFVPRARAMAWSWLFALALASWWLTREATGFGLPLLQLLAFDPAWVAPARRARPVRVFYDGSCALCHGFVRFVLAEDRAGAVRFAPLQGPTFERALAPERRAALPDSVVVLDEEGRPLVRSEGVRHVLATLGGLWRLLALAQVVFPRSVRDGVYDAIASVRKRVFGTTKDACPLMPRALGARFDP